jgi:mevalonate kinase
MTVTHTASAPGKLVLVGEYAVLDGAPAISAAVDVFATAKKQPLIEKNIYWQIIICGC